MSVTFMAAQAPAIDMMMPCGCGGEKDCPDCQGTDLFAYPVTAGSVNFTNANAQAILQLLGFKSDLQGEWCEAELPAIRRRLLYLINCERQRASAIRPYYEGSCLRVLPFTDEGIVKRLQALLGLVIQAQTNHWGSIYWG